MPNLTDIVDIAESLGSEAVYVAADRCVAVRNRNVACTKCVDACLAGAIEVGQNKVRLSRSACVGCGACTTVCPTEALVSLSPLDAELSESIARATVETEGLAVFACARMAARRTADPKRFAEVPCLARMEESVLLELAARGVNDIVLVDGVCKTCKYRATGPGIDATLASTNDLLAMQGSDVRIRRMSEFPESVLSQDAEGLYGASRRSFFTQAGSLAKDAAGKTVATMVKDGRPTAEPTLRERLGLKGGDALPQFEPRRRMAVLEALDSLGQPVVPTIDTRLFGAVDIDEKKCRSCGMCSTFCPTGALHKVEDEELAPGEGLRLEFRAMECVQCRTCEDVCLSKCLTVSSCMPTGQLFDFEPETFHLPTPAKTGLGFRF